MSTTNKGASALSVLIVEDDDFAQEVLLGMLEDFGINDIHTADDGRDGLRVLEAMPSAPDFIICDILMPDMDGMKFLAELVKVNHKGKVILVSGIDSEILAIAEQAVASDGIHIVGAFVKPIKNEVLAKAMGLSE